MDGALFEQQLTSALGDIGLLKERQCSRAAFSPGLSYGRHFAPPLPTTRSAAVTLLIDTDPTIPWLDWTIPLTVRPNHLQNHPGQISLPGGRVEPDESLIEAAQRELEEELGVGNLQCRIFGSLQSLFVYNSNFEVTPFIARCHKLTNVVPCPQEVARVIHLPLRQLLVSKPLDESLFSRGLAVWKAPVIRHGDDLIWGATAMILGEFTAVLKHAFRKLLATSAVRPHT